LGDQAGRNRCELGDLTAEGNLVAGRRVGVELLGEASSGPDSGADRPGAQFDAGQGAAFVDGVGDAGERGCGT
jgi:hypothetical protein